MPCEITSKDIMEAATQVIRVVFMEKVQDKAVSLRREMMSKAMMQVADKFSDENAREVAKELAEMSKKNGSK